MYRIWIYSVLLILNFSLISASEEGLQIGLEEAIQRALAEAPSMKEAQYGVKKAESKYKQAKSGKYPRVEVQNVFGVVPEARGDATFSPDEDTDIDNLGPFNRLKIQLFQPLYAFGRLEAGIQAAEYNIQVSQFKVAENKAQVVYQVKQIYYGLMLATHLLDLVSEIENKFQEAIKKAEERAELGEVREVDVLKLKVGHAQIQKQEGRLKREVSIGKDAFRNIIGLPEGCPFNLAGKLRPLKVDGNSLEGDLKKLFDFRPEWLQIKYGLDAKKAEVEVEDKSRYPVLFVAGEFRHAIANNRDDQKNPFVNDDFNFLGGGLVFGVKWDWDFGSNARVEEKEYELKEIMAQREAALKGFPLQAKKSYLELIEMENAIQITRKGKKAARSLMVLTLTNYNFGIGEAKELFEALGLYINAASDYYKSVHDFNMSLARLSQVVGQELTELKY